MNDSFSETFTLFLLEQKPKSHVHAAPKLAKVRKNQKSFNVFIVYYCVCFCLVVVDIEI